MTGNNQTIDIIVALDEQNAIGRRGGLLCRLPDDLKHFKQITGGHTVVMGRRTFESLPNGPLPNRTNIVVTSGHAGNYPGCIVVRSLCEAVEKSPSGKETFVIGGGQLYRSALPFANMLYLTRIHHTFDDADTFFPGIDFEQWELLGKETHRADEKHLYAYTFSVYKRKKGNA